MPNVTNKEIRRTAIFKSLAEATRPEDHDKLARLLHGHQNDWLRTCTTSFDGKQTSLLRAFSWSLTREGFAFWNDYYDRLKNAGWEEQTK